MSTKNCIFIILIFSIILISLIHYYYKNKTENFINEQILLSNKEQPSYNKNLQLQNNNFVDYSGLNYPNYSLKFPITLGCGGRRGACMGGSQIPIPNTLPPVNISNENIAPTTVNFNENGNYGNFGIGNYEDIRQVGTIQQVFGNDNVVYPLFGRRIYRNDNKWEYWTRFGTHGVVLPIIPLRNYQELSTNDRVYIEGQKKEYRVIIYDNYIPQYFPFQ